MNIKSARTGSDRKIRDKKECKKPKGCKAKDKRMRGNASNDEKIKPRP